MLQVFREEITKHIANANFDLAFTTSDAFLKQEGEVFNDFLAIRARYKLLITQERRNLITREQASVERANITHALLQTVEVVASEDLIENKLNVEDEEDWGFYDYLDLYNESQLDFRQCLEEINKTQKTFREALEETKLTLESIKNRSKSQITSQKKEVTKKLAKELNSYTDNMALEMEKYDELVNRTCYSSFRLLEFMLQTKQKINKGNLKNLIINVENFKEAMKKIEANTKSAKKVFGRKMIVGREFSAAMRRAHKKQDLFIEKCEKCIVILDNHKKNIELLIIEFTLNNSFLYKILAFLGFKRKIEFKKHDLGES